MMRIAKAIAISIIMISMACAITACGGTASKGPVYLKTKQVYYNTSNGNVDSELNWSYDANGNKTKLITKIISNGAEAVVENTYSDFDKDGYPAIHSATNGKEVRESTCTYTRENGRVVEAEDSETGKETYTYYDNGQVKTLETSNASGTTRLYEFDEDGYVIKSSSSGGKDNNNKNYTYMWTKDENGHPVELVFNSPDSPLPINYTIQCDENGNMLRLYTATGKLYEECEYTRIDSPSTVAWIEAHKISA